ncbi:MAG: hypothetical protein PHV93_01120 [Candidatus Pacebacteria bacterium]|nr:hypothetical protein [Candidatus Paceibacterota bacterium]
MFFMLQHARDDEQNPGRKSHTQLGIVVAENIELAATKLGMKVLEVVRPPESGCWYASLENGYCLESFKEIRNEKEIPFHQM